MNHLYTIKEGWTYVYGNKSHMNLAGKIILGVPVFPFFVLILCGLILFDSLTIKQNEQTNKN